VRRLTDDYPAAAQALEQALGIYRDLGDHLGQADALYYLGDMRQVTGDYPAAVRALEQALDRISHYQRRHAEYNEVLPEY
jgi:tetratricopeptide (TPR) repeat protein